MLAAAGVARSTYDIDLFTGDPSVLRAEPSVGLREQGVSVDVRRGDADDPLGGVVRLEASAVVAQLEADLLDLPRSLQSRWADVRG